MNINSNITSDGLISSSHPYFKFILDRNTSPEANIDLNLDQTPGFRLNWEYVTQFGHVKYRKFWNNEFVR